MSVIPKGFTFVPGRSREKALLLITISKELDLPVVDSVLSQRDGYIVDDKIVAEVEKRYENDDVAIADPPDSSFDPLNTNAEPWTPEVVPAKSQPRPRRTAKDAKAEDQARQDAEAKAQKDDEAEAEAAEKAAEAPSGSTDASTPEADAATGTQEIPQINEGDTVIAGVDPAAAGVDPDTVPEAEVTEEPARNAARDEWVTYVSTLPGHDPADLVSLEDDDAPGMSRKALIEKYGAAV